MKDLGGQLHDTGDVARMKLTRRAVLQSGSALALGAAGALAVPAGLGQRLTAAQGATTPTGGEYHGWWPYSPPPVGHFNSFLANAITLGIYLGVAELPLALYKWEGAEFIPLLATEWKLTPPDTFQITLRDGVKWSDGSSFTADDVVTTFTILQLQSAPVWNYLGAVRAIDSRNVEFKMANPSSIVPYFVLRTNIRAHSVYGNWAKQTHDLFAAHADLASPTPSAASQKAKAALVEQFNKFQPKSMVVTGPYQVDPGSITSSQLSLKKVKTSFLANTANFDKLIIYNQTGPGSIDTLVINHSIDYGTSGFPPATERAMIAAGLRIARPPTYFGPALHINYAKVKGLANPVARQAIAMAIDRAVNGKVSLGDSGVPSKYMTGVPDLLIEQWLDQATLGQMNQYQHDPAKAAQLLTGAGYKKQDGVWVSPEGEHLSYELSEVAEHGDWAAAATNLAEQLTEFGIKTVVRTMPQAQWTANLAAGNFQLGIEAWGQGQPHPYFSFYTDLFANNQPLLAKGISFPMQQETQAVGKVDLKQLTIQSAEGLDTKAQIPIIAKLARAFNELLPIIPLWERYGNDPILPKVRVSGWPADSDPLFHNSVYADNFAIMWLLDGTLKGVKK